MLWPNSEIEMNAPGHDLRVSMMKTRFKNWTASPRLHRLLYHAIRIYSSSFRLTIVNEDQWQACIRQGGRVMLCVWHQQFFAMIRYCKRYESYRPALMISQSSDGDLIAGVARLSGWYAVRGSTSRGGKQALRILIKHFRKHKLAGHIMDGPRGPIGQVKAGAIRLALAADAVIVPMYVSADRAWYFNSWDRFFIPKPFAAVTVRFGHPIGLRRTRSGCYSVEQALDKAGLEKLFQSARERPS